MDAVEKELKMSGTVTSVILPETLLAKVRMEQARRLLDGLDSSLTQVIRDALNYYLVDEVMDEAAR